MDSHLLLEDGSFLLLQDGSRLILESFALYRLFELVGSTANQVINLIGDAN